MSVVPAAVHTGSERAWCAEEECRRFCPCSMWRWRQSVYSRQPVASFGRVNVMIDCLSPLPPRPLAVLPPPCCLLKARLFLIARRVPDDDGVALSVHSCLLLPKVSRPQKGGYARVQCTPVCPPPCLHVCGARAFARLLLAGTPGRCARRGACPCRVCHCYVCPVAFHPPPRPVTSLPPRRVS